ncbi:hypothetical protein [Streptomyces sp. NPDC001970]
MSHRRHASKWAALPPVLALTALTALTGCSADKDGRTRSGAPDVSDVPAKGAPGVTAIPEITTRVEKPVPVQDYLLSDAQWRQLGEAGEVLRQRCMQRFGLTYEIATPAQNGPGQTISEYRYGILDPKYTARHGYLTPSALAQSATSGKPAAGAEQLARMSKDEQLVLLGTTDPKVSAADQAQATGGQKVRGRTVPKGGCVGESQEKLGGTADSGIGDAQIANDVNLNSFAKSLEDTRVRQVFTEWSACMKAKGYAYETPIQASNDKRWSPERGSAEEKATATADAECKMEKNVTGVWYAVDVAYQNQMIQQHRTELDAVKKGIDERMRLAAQATTP